MAEEAVSVCSPILIAKQGLAKKTFNKKIENSNTIFFTQFIITHYVIKVLKSCD